MEPIVVIVRSGKTSSRVYRLKAGDLTETWDVPSMEKAESMVKRYEPSKRHLALTSDDYEATTYLSMTDLAGATGVTVKELRALLRRSPSARPSPETREAGSSPSPRPPAPGEPSS